MHRLYCINRQIYYWQ